MPCYEPFIAPLESLNIRQVCGIIREKSCQFHGLNLHSSPCQNVALGSVKLTCPSGQVKLYLPWASGQPLVSNVDYSLYMSLEEVSVFRDFLGVLK